SGGGKTPPKDTYLHRSMKNLHRSHLKDDSGGDFILGVLGQPLFAVKEVKQIGKIVSRLFR
ncbi:hypothetical protein ACE1TI_14375, partial [Alteribacillus sp. JSM 102045]|uniref:hypothetical protein n=1 Tax=Alteribacillus sp. JSM 102045 TaxID=1562101 RepID=UPI0035C13E06